MKTICLLSSLHSLNNYKKISIAALALCLFTTQSFANVLGDFQTFVPNTDGLHFITVDSAQTLKQYTIVGNAYASYAKDYLLVYDNLNNQKRIVYKDQTISIDGTLGFSVTDNLQVYLGVTELADYKTDKSNSSQYYVSQGVHSYRPGVKWKFDSEKNSEQALVASVDLLNVKNDPYTGENPPAILTRIAIAKAEQHKSC